MNPKFEYLIIGNNQVEIYWRFLCPKMVEIEMSCFDAQLVLTPILFWNWDVFAKSWRKVVDPMKVAGVATCELLAVEFAWILLLYPRHIAGCNTTLAIKVCHFIVCKGE